jgi:hypothetical protein
MTTWTPPKGQGVDKVRAALRAFDLGTGTYDEVKAAVAQAVFAVRPTALSLDELAANWDYQPMLDTFTDTVQVALFSRVITKSQFDELAAAAKYTGPEPSR